MEKEFKEGAEKVIRACGEIIRNADRSELGIESKEGHANFVTKYDALVQKELQEGLKELRPDAAFLGEEGDSSEYPDAEEVFIVDPIDGTTNFMVGLDHSCISVALARKREVVYAAIYNPFTDAYYEAEKGGGAYRNHEPIHVSGEPLERGVAYIGTAPYYEELTEVSFAKAREYLKRCIDIRRSGSAALDLCCVAEGRAVIFFEAKLQPWDYAAGSLIVKEAGGGVMDWNGRPLEIGAVSSVVAYGRGVTGIWEHTDSGQTVCFAPVGEGIR